MITLRDCIRLRHKYHKQFVGQKAVYLLDDKCTLWGPVTLERITKAGRYLVYSNNPIELFASWQPFVNHKEGSRFRHTLDTWRVVVPSCEIREHEPATYVDDYTNYGLKKFLANWKKRFQKWWDEVRFSAEYI